jgi:chorismate synthase
MKRIRFLTSGESHGRALSGIIEGIPSGVPLASADIDIDLKRRQGGYGRGGRMKIESDHADILSGVRKGKTLGSPIALMIENRDWVNWQTVMGVEYSEQETETADSKHKQVTKPRPGHADLAGAIKYDTHDIRDILERSSARETAMRVALGAVAKKFLSDFKILTGSYVVRLGSLRTAVSSRKMRDDQLIEIFHKAEKSPVRCPDSAVSKKMVALIDAAMKKGDSLGGLFEVFVTGLPPGLGSHIQWDRRLDGRLAQAVMGIQAMKGVEIGSGFEMAGRSGSKVMDEIFCAAKGNMLNGKEKGFYRKTNYAGGIEGGMTNGMPVILRAAMKPIPTLRRPLRSVDIRTKEAIEAMYERSDICAVPAAGVIGEAMVALTIADAFLEKFGGDSLSEVRRNYESYIEYVNSF